LRGRGGEKGVCGNRAIRAFVGCRPRTF
jgi:hypothetical protein